LSEVFLTDLMFQELVIHPP